MVEEIGVYGLGRFGVFWASLLSNSYKVKVYSRTKRDSLPKGLIQVSEDELLETGVLFLCVSISSLEEVLIRIRERILPGTLVMDTCSVKVYPAVKMREHLKKGVSIIATHPMFGPDSAKNGIEGLPIIISPIRCDVRESDYWIGFFKSIGLMVSLMEPDAHDREAAYTQGITHYIGRVFADLKLENSEIATLGYKKILEIMEQTCNDPWQLFLDIQKYNPYTKEMRIKLHNSLEKIFSQLECSLNIHYDKDERRRDGG